MHSPEEIEEKRRKARLLADLGTHPGWKVVEEKLELEIDNQLNLLQQVGLDHSVTEGIRFRLQSMRWLLKTTHIATDEQFAKWERALAFQHKQEQNRQRMGLPTKREDLPV